MMKKQKTMSWMKGQVTIPEKQLNEVEIGNLAEKQTNKIRIKIVKMIQDLGKTIMAKIEKMQEMFTKDLQN